MYIYNILFNIKSKYKLIRKNYIDGLKKVNFLTQTNFNTSN